ncbi:MAG: beta-galactosidase [Steroidobacteraceae bacterium]
MLHNRKFLIAILAATLASAAMASSPNDESLRRGVADPYPSSSPAEFQKRLDLYKQAGIGILRIDLGWRGHETPDGVWQDSTGLPLLQLAKQNGFLFKGAFGGMSGPPAWFFEKHPDAQMVNSEGLKSFNVISYWYPDLHSLLEDKDDHVFAYISKQGLLNSIAYVIVPLGPAGEPLYPVPWTTTEPNKPIRFWFYDPHAQADFPRKMQAKYVTISAANKAWGTSFADWPSVKIPAPHSQPGPMWHDVLDWYRDSKRDFITWQVGHYQRLLAKYYPAGNAPRLLLLVPGNHIAPYEGQQAISTGDGNDSIKMMADSEFVLDLAHKVGAYAQYTGIPNMRELAYLEGYMRRQKYDVPLWGENAGNKGDPQELDEEVLSNGLYGQEYIGSNLVDIDHVSPTAQFASLSNAHTWLAAVRAGKAEPIQTFDSLSIPQGGCVYGDTKKLISLCMQDDGNLVLRKNAQPIWASNTSHEGQEFCSTTEDPASACSALFQGDGNFVVKRGTQAIWSSGTGQRGKHFLILNEAPYIEISTAADQIVWKAMR